MEGYNKTVLRNHKGEVLLPRTTASMVSEESDRRFVDNVEKTLLNTIAVNSEAISELIKNAQSIGALSSVDIQLLNLLDTVPDDLQEWKATLEDLSVLRDKVPELLYSLVAPPRLISDTSKKTYMLQIDDTDLDNPRIIIVQENAVNQQPEGYKAGDEWFVGESAPDVKISVPLNKIAIIKNSSLVNFAAGEAAEGLTGDDIDKIFSDLGHQVSSDQESVLPQAYISFDVVNTLETHFQTDLSQTIKKFTLKVGVKPDNATAVKTQAFSQGELIQPVRTNTDKTTFTQASFSGLTWQMSIDGDFINNFLNGAGKIALLSYVDGNAATKDFYINKPTLDIFIENPYKGKSITAIADQEGEFNILDWELVED